MKFYRLLLVSVVMMAVFISGTCAAADAGKSGRISVAGTNYDIEYKNTANALFNFRNMAGNIETLMKDKKFTDKDRKYLIDALDVELDMANLSASEIVSLQKQFEEQKNNLTGLKTKIELVLKKLSTYSGHRPKNFKRTPRPVQVKKPDVSADETIQKLYEAVVLLNDIDYAIDNFMLDKKAKSQIEKELKKQSANTYVLLETARVKAAEIEAGSKNIAVIRVKIAELLQKLTSYEPPEKEREEYKPKMLKK